MTFTRIERGIYLRGGIYYICYQNEVGEMIWKSTQQKSLKAARQILDKAKTDVALFKSLPERRYESVRWAELADAWWQREGSKNASQWRYLIPRIKDRFGKMRARQVTSDVVQDFLEALRTQLSASSCNHHRTILGRIFNFAIERKQYDQNPVKAVSQFREPRGRDRFASREELKKVLAKLADDPEVLAAIIVLATTTLRKGELLKRKTTEVNLDSDPPHIFIPQTKNGDSKRIPISDLAATYLRSLPRTGEYLFPSRPTARWPKPKTPYRWYIGKEWREACAAASVENLRIHDLRHMGVSILTELGLAPEIIRKLSGHRGRQLDRYQHLSKKLQEQTVNLITDTIFADKDGQEMAKPETVH